jgi:hypothetical protein
MRMSVVQYESYERLCASNETNITVQNVSVSDGGQAIVGNITHNGESGKGVTSFIEHEQGGHAWADRHRKIWRGDLYDNPPIPIICGLLNRVLPT